MNKRKAKSPTFPLLFLLGRIFTWGEGGGSLTVCEAYGETPDLTGLSLGPPWLDVRVNALRRAIVRTIIYNTERGALFDFFRLHQRHLARMGRMARVHEPIATSVLDITCNSLQQPSNHSPAL